ncbi:hypothetical protein Ssi03_13160 [Sphaerisporangium siamense]|uniref:Uncharacterized protein n=1 Tax=Sphaerisporangium siamense TaxID=795645 RepID=A0A7W7D9T6_9ACTN|nr:hypothetical protein [Sphaerisporangium siamense]MBB4702915.1 hypothetical protein [Sphaerisporangium siamense]GII83326.1 hypothetical protein Ssi03_13160 [Sphaerisporangium siamense]
MCKQVERKCGCKLKVNDYRDFQTVAEVDKWCYVATQMVSKLARVRGKRRLAAEVMDEINAHVLFA